MLRHRAIARRLASVDPHHYLADVVAVGWHVLRPRALGEPADGEPDLGLGAGAEAEPGGGDALAGEAERAAGLEHDAVGEAALAPAVGVEARGGLDPQRDAAGRDVEADAVAE